MSALVEFEDSATSEKVFQTLNETHWPTDIPEDHASNGQMSHTKLIVPSF